MRSDAAASGRERLVLVELKSSAATPDLNHIEIGGTRMPHQGLLSTEVLLQHRLQMHDIIVAAAA